MGLEKRIQFQDPLTKLFFSCFKSKMLEIHSTSSLKKWPTYNIASRDVLQYLLSQDIP